MLSPDHPMVEYLEALHDVVVGVFGNILDEKIYVHGSNGKVTDQKAPVLVHHVPEYVRRNFVRPTTTRFPTTIVCVPQCAAHPCILHQV